MTGGSYVPIALALSAAIAAAQPQPTTPPTPSPAAQPTQEIPPQLLLGRRLANAAASWAPISTVVIVSDAVSYCHAISAWTPTARFPVLIDDGSFNARENIARFVRGYKPAHIVRYTSPDAKGAGADTFANADVGLIRTGIAASWGVGAEDVADGSKLAASWAAHKHAPAGLVFINQNDPAWTAGFALAAGRGQPLLFLDVRQQPDGYLSMAEAAKLSADVRQGATNVGLEFARLGDNIDAVTLCVNAPVKFRPDEVARDMLALTDFVGRMSDSVNDNPRWAWCGQIQGDAASAAYRAMGSLFIQPRSAWMFDGYENTPGWNEYDATSSGEILKKSGLLVEVLDTPAQGAREWRMRAARPIDAGLITVTSKGNSDFFDLQPGQCKPADVPILSIPAAIHFTHSWSIERPGDRNTVGGRWMERGAFLYVGSVHEPLLPAFVPNPVLVGRLAAGAPFIASSRQENGQFGAKPWKIATLGDPLFSLCNPPALRDDATGLKDCKAVDATLRDDLTAGKYADALSALVLVGRDADAAKLAAKLRQDKPTEFKGAAAAAAVLPLFRTGQNREVLLAFALADDRDRRNDIIRDAALLASAPFRESGADPEVAAALKVLDEAAPK